jgi:hypothetical protein
LSYFGAVAGHVAVRDSGTDCFALPRHEVIRAVKAGGDTPVVRKAVIKGGRGVPALHMKLWIEHSFGKEIGINASHGVTRYLGEEIGSAVFASGARTRFQSEGREFSALH